MSSDDRIEAIGTQIVELFGPNSFPQHDRYFNKQNIPRRVRKHTLHMNTKPKTSSNTKKNRWMLRRRDSEIDIMYTLFRRSTLNKVTTKCKQPNVWRVTWQMSAKTEIEVIESYRAYIIFIRAFALNNIRVPSPLSAINVNS